jgi:hypothetical protein
MKLTWWDAAHSKVLAQLDEGETLGDLTGPGSFQIIASPLNADFAALEGMDPKPQIADAPGTEAKAAKAAEPAKAAPQAAKPA